jgi:hypothetical protein
MELQQHYYNHLHVQQRSHINYLVCNCKIDWYPIFKSTTWNYYGTMTFNMKNYNPKNKN